MSCFPASAPKRPESLPNVNQYEHSSLVALRPQKPAPDAETAVKSKPRDAAQDDLLYKLQDKPLRPLQRLVISALEYISMPDLTQDYDDNFRADIKAELNTSRQMVRCFALHTFALHSNIVHRRKILSMTVLGCSKHEGRGHQICSQFVQHG